MDIDPRRLRVLHEVARRGGVIRAAEALHLTPSAVSQQLAQLEREVGLALIDRSQRSVSLTPAGRVLAGYAERVEEELTEARRELTRFTERLAGPVRIAAFPTVIRHVLVPAIRELAACHPKIVPVIHEVYGQPALRELRLGSVDLLITEQDMGLPTLPQPSLSTRLLYVDEYRIVLPPDLPDPPRTVADLARLPWVAGEPTQATGQALERLAGLHGFEPRKSHVISDFESALALVAAGHGVAIVPTLALLDVPAGEVRVSELREVGERRLDAVTRVGRTRSGEPDPVQAVVIRAIEEATAALESTLRVRLGPSPQE
ncbi:LysR family transcriptional regulator [Nonomuraea jiangxiensis]|uniref:DNA-binding transcriptional regulator, LysR family n=1 Tax=Nonomuraea jiangxiensis TaxID=633440 RepID=A0A1G8RGJ0_9ACTN|nr:LysR family transcriptional regulator [Nonomuraea jiangxiensis]SDJ16214.1 DNA-binding transcriptional regulator, LysR family [Nonomuraea jiangxiensis]